MVCQLRRPGDTGADREGEGPIGQGKLHISSACSEGEKDSKTAPEDHKAEDGDTIQHRKQFKTKGYLSRDCIGCDGAKYSGGGHRLSQGTENDPQGWDSGGAGSAVMG